MLCILRRSLRPRNPDRTGWNECGSADMDLISPFLRMASCQSSSSLQPVPARSSSLDTLAPDHLHAPITFLRFPLSDGESLLPAPLSILFCLGPLRSACLAYTRHLRLLPVRIPLTDRRPLGGECVLLLAVSPAPRPAPKATQSLESTSYQLQINTDQLTDASALGFLNP